MRSLSSILIGVVLCACAADRARFRPAENVTASGHGGQPAAAYDVRASPGEEPTVHVSVWSHGARRLDDRTLVRLALELRNTGDQPVMLDTGALRLEAHGNEGRALPEPQLVRVTANTAPGGMVEPGEASTFQLYYALPRSIAPDAIGSMRLRWGLEHDDGRQYIQFTAFHRVPEYSTVGVGYGIGYYDPVFGFYDPYFYGAPYRFHARYHVPVRRVIVDRRDRPRVESRPRPSAR